MAVRVFATSVRRIGVKKIIIQTKNSLRPGCSPLKLSQGGRTRMRLGFRLVGYGGSPGRTRTIRLSRVAAMNHP
jgi:hypothetical protein